PVALRLLELGLVMDMGHRAIIARQLIVMIHLDRIKRAEFRAVTAVHADVDVDIEGFWLRNWALGHRVLSTHDPDALWRAYLGADTAACTPVLTRCIRMIFIIHHQKRDETEAFRHSQFLI